MWESIKDGCVNYHLIIINLFSMMIGQLLLPTEDTVEIILLCSGCSICPTFFQSIWQWSLSDVLRRLSQCLVPSGADSIHSTRCLWGKSKNLLPVCHNIQSVKRSIFFQFISQEIKLLFIMICHLGNMGCRVHQRKYSMVSISQI